MASFPFSAWAAGSREQRDLAATAYSLLSNSAHATAPDAYPDQGKILCRPVLGGLIDDYYRKAA